MPSTTKKKSVPKASKSKLSFTDLVGLIGKRSDDPDVVAMIAALGAKKDSDYIVAKNFGIEFALGYKEGEKKKALSAMFLHGPREQPARIEYDGLPSPFEYSNRAAMRAAKQPDAAWTMDDGDVPLIHEASERDTWHMDGYDISATYRKDGSVASFYVKGTSEASGGDSVLVNPLHFATKPVDAPPEAELVAPALVVGWATSRFGASPKHAKAEAGKQFAKRAISPVTFLKTACKKTLTTLDFDPKLHKFLRGYMHQTFTGTRAPNRDATAKTIATLWGREEADTRYFDDDYQAAFQGAVASLYHVPDSWEAVDRLGALMDARWADFVTTEFKQTPDLKLYEKAAKTRDAIKIVPTTKVIGAQTRDDSLTKDLLSLIGKPLKDPAVKPIFERASLPIGKRIDEQANPELGIVYLGTNCKIGGKPVLIVEYFRFRSTGESASVRGIGKTVTFIGYPNALPGGFLLGATRKEVAKAYGKPAKTGEDYDLWYSAKDKMIAAHYDERGNLANIKYGPPPEWEEPPAPPYSPADIY